MEVENFPVICVTNSMQTLQASEYMKHQYMKDLDIPVISVMFHHSLNQVASNNINQQCMKDLDIPAISVMFHHSLTQVTSDNIKHQHMKELDMNVTNVIIKQQQRIA